MEQVHVKFNRRAIIAGGPLYLPGETAIVPSDMAQQFCDSNAATLITSLDEAPKNKMVANPVHKKGAHG